ncbi:hypothetical protein WMY93_003956 [Mugilogobius chulae]|uniref:Coiled-coil domain-containing protein 117 n=1 Tax=Mugilogobius chulae TaxID=88201 RepID=A0AAW0PTK4_9GOBI
MFTVVYKTEGNLRGDSCSHKFGVKGLVQMHQPVPVAPLGLLPSMYPFCVPNSLPTFDLGAHITAPLLHEEHFSNSWETRCLRKHRRRSDDEVCSPKRRRLMETDPCSPHSSADWKREDSCSSVAPPGVPPLPSHTPLSQFGPGTHSSCSMEVEAAQRRLREIEDRITLEDDSDSELEVEVCPRRPVLVLSDSLKEGLQRGLSDILPHTVAQSVSHSCMELVLWRPPDDPFSHKLKETLHKQQRKQQQQQQQQQRGPQNPPTPCPSPAPHRDTAPALYSHSHSQSQGQGEEDMEM